MQDTATDADEWVEEEQLVVVELSGIIDPEYLSKCSRSSFKVIGIETEQPVLQLGSYIFAGQHKNMLGTAVVFEKKEEGGDEEQGSEEQQWKYKCHTDKKIEMQRAHLRPKQPAQEAAKSSQESKAQTKEQPEAPT